jgi:hypothetical protein
MKQIYFTTNHDYKRNMNLKILHYKMTFQVKHKRPTTTAPCFLRKLLAQTHVPKIFPKLLKITHQTKVETSGFFTALEHFLTMKHVTGSGFRIQYRKKKYLLFTCQLSDPYVLKLQNKIKKTGNRLEIILKSMSHMLEILNDLSGAMQKETFRKTHKD